MLNALSKPKQVREEMEQDWEGAQYWFHKKMGGEKKLAKLAMIMFQEAKRTKIDQCSEHIEWQSKNGNKWCIFLVIKFYEKANYPYPHLMGFCYYKTAASIGAFMPISSAAPNGKKAESFTIHYTDHFFHRLAGRAGIKADSPQNIKGFIQFVYSSFVMINPEKGGGKSKHGNDADIVVKLPASYGFGGINEQDGEMMFSVDSFLLNSNLNSYQRKLVRKLDNFAKDNSYMPEELSDYLTIKQIANKDYKGMKKEADRVWDMQLKAGVPEWYLKRIEAITGLFYSISCDCGIIDKDNMIEMYEFFKSSTEIIHKACASPNYKNAELVDIILTYRECAIAAGYAGKFNIKTIFEYFVTKLPNTDKETFKAEWSKNPLPNDLKYHNVLLDYDEKDNNRLLTTK